MYIKVQIAKDPKLKVWHAAISISYFFIWVFMYIKVQIANDPKLKVWLSCSYLDFLFLYLGVYVYQGADC